MASASHTAFSRHTRGWMSIRSNAELVTSPSKLERNKGFFKPFEGRVWWWVSEKVQVLSESVFRRPSLDDEATFCPAHYRTKDGKRRESILPKRAIVGSRVSTSTNHEKCWLCPCTAKAGARNKMERLTVSLNLNKQSKKFMVTKIWLYWMLRTISSSFDTFWVNPITSKGFYKVQISQYRIWNWCRKNGCHGRIMKIRNLGTSHECCNLVRKWKVLWSRGAKFSLRRWRQIQIVECKSWSPELAWT